MRKLNNLSSFGIICSAIQLGLALKPATIKVYLDLHSYFNGHNNGQIQYSLNHGAKRLSLGKHTVKAALAQLIDHGFIVCTKRGYFTGRQASTWRLTTQTAVGFPATNEWKRFQPPKKPKKIPDIGVENILQEIKNDPISVKMTMFVYKETYF